MASTVKQAQTGGAEADAPQPRTDDGGAAAKRKRVQVDFSPDAYARLENMRAKSGAQSNAELVRNALRLYDWFVRQRDEGFEVRLVKGDEERSVELMW